MQSHASWKLAFAVALAMFIAGCQSDEPPANSLDPGFTPLSGEADSFTDYEKTIEARGPEEMVVVDPASGSLAWRAMICDLSECAGRGPDGEAPLFAYKHTGVVVGEDGKPDWTAVAVDDMAVVERLCPFCNRTEAIKPFVQTDTLRRRERLEAELMRVRAIRDKDEREGRTPRATQRTPNVIMNDLTDLPKTFLIEKTP